MEWRGLRIALENRCAPYDRRDYPYPASVEARIVAAMGGQVYGPYTGRVFASRRDTDIEHIVATSEAHDSGLSARDAATKRRFARDLLNLTLAAPEVNRCGRSGKCGFDAGEWLPPRNRCWFAARVVAVKRKYALAVDAREAAALENVLTRCNGTTMIMPPTTPPDRRYRRARPPHHARTGTRFRAGMTMATAASSAARRGATPSRPCRAAVPPIPTCETATATESPANNAPDAAPAAHPGPGPRSRATTAPGRGGKRGGGEAPGIGGDEPAGRDPGAAPANP